MKFRLRTLLRYAWAMPCSALGMAVALLALALGGRAQWRIGALEVHGGLLADACRRLPAHQPFSAITLGHVILGLDADCLDAARDHEQVHVRQYERWGLFFVPLYLGSSAWQRLHGRCPYRDNCFEREAYRQAVLGCGPSASRPTAKVE